jgi:hypothetical protein
VNGPEHVSVGIALNELGRAEYASRRYREATAAWQRAVAILERWWGPKHRLSALAAMNLGNGKRIEKRFEEAEKILTRTMHVFEELDQKSLLATSLYYLAIVHADQGKHSQAEALLRRSLAISDTAMGTVSPHSGICATGLARSLLALGRVEEAESLHRRGLAITEKTFGTNSPELPDALEVQASILRKLKRKSEAAEFDKRARSLRESQISSHWSGLTVDASQLERRNRE